MAARGRRNYSSLSSTELRMRREAYAAARSISQRLHLYFAKHRETALQWGEIRVAWLPEIEIIEALIDAAFWASLRREEGFIPRMSLAYLPQTQAEHPLVFERPFPSIRPL
jgi:Probable sensor domain DACNV